MLRGVYSIDKINRFQLVIVEVCVSGIAIGGKVTTHSCCLLIFYFACKHVQEPFF